LASHFSQLFWGLLLVILDLSINGFDLIADGVGYVIVALGCRGLSQLSNKFTTAQVLCVVLAVLWVLGFAVPGVLAVPFTMVVWIAEGAMMWHLLGGIGEFAMSRQRQDLADKASTIRVAYIVFMAATSLLVIAMQVSPGMVFLVLPLLVITVILVVVILHFIHRVKVELAASPETKELPEELVKPEP